MSVYKKSKLRGSKFISAAGFTIVEMLVAIFVFTIVMVISMGAILSTLDANKKTQTVQLVIDNVDFALEGMARTLRTGYLYHCDENVPPITDPRDCTTGADSISFEEASGDPNDSTDNYVYQYNTGGKYIERSTNGGVSFIPLTASNVEITSLMFYVMNSDPTDGIQPRSIISLRGRAGAEKIRTKTEFNLQTIVTQRLPDIDTTGLPSPSPSPSPGPSPSPSPSPGPLPGPRLFLVSNSSGAGVAGFSDTGDLILAGMLTPNSGVSPGASDFVIRTSAGALMGFADISNGNMHIAGSLTQNASSFPATGASDFVILDGAGTIQALLTSSGNLVIRGSLFEFGLP